MDARTKLNKLITGALGMMTYLFEEIKKPSGRELSINKGSPGPEMLRVTDVTGDEYLCPVDKLKDKNFVGEQEKNFCFDYGSIAEHYLEGEIAQDSSPGFV